MMIGWGVNVDTTLLLLRSNEIERGLRHFHTPRWHSKAEMGLGRCEHYGAFGGRRKVNGRRTRRTLGDKMTGSTSKDIGLLYFKCIIYINRGRMYVIELL